MKKIKEKVPDKKEVNLGKKEIIANEEILEEAALEAEDAIEFKRMERLQRQQLESLGEKYRSALPIPDVPFKFFFYTFREYKLASARRIRMGGRVRSLEKKGQRFYLLMPVLKNLRMNETATASYLRRLVIGSRLWTEFASDIKGLGYILTAWILMYVRIKRCKYPSQLWSYCGLSVRDGKGARLTKGEQAKFHVKLKSKLIWLGQSFIKNRNPRYYGLYLTFKREYHNDHPEKVFMENGKSRYSDMHLHRMALRKMVKIFLLDLYVILRQIEGLKVWKPYEQAVLGKKPAEVDPDIAKEIEEFAEKKEKEKLKNNLKKYE